ncbi:hypothetical protein HanRHA438_Chr01g0002591 [Helianthus annuus]|nr:hypothetical protein HanRHA438_Chr01g0002591 [Helianthus annuus]
MDLCERVMLNLWLELPLRLLVKYVLGRNKLVSEPWFERIKYEKINT